MGFSSIQKLFFGIDIEAMTSKVLCLCISKKSFASDVSSMDGWGISIDQDIWAKPLTDASDRAEDKASSGDLRPPSVQAVGPSFPVSVARPG